MSTCPKMLVLLGLVGMRRAKSYLANGVKTDLIG